MKLELFKKHLRQNNIDAAIFFSKGQNFVYFVQEKIPDSLLIIFSKGSPLILVTPLANQKYCYTAKVSKDFKSDIKKIFKKRKIKTLGVNKRFLTVSQHNKLRKFGKLVDIRNSVFKLRLTKTPEEIQKIRKACRKTDKIFDAIIDNFKQFKTEEDIRKFIKILAIEEDCELSFDPVVASGVNAVIPHYTKNSKLKKGFLVLDFGLKYKGYCSDLTRTIYLGKPSEKELNFYLKIVWIQDETIKQIKPGIQAAVLDKFARDYFGKDKEYFIHSLGHGIGLNIHEEPALAPKSKVILDENMVFTIEPGYYNKIGIRVEDDILVTKKGHKFLTQSPRHLIFIKDFGKK